MATSFREEIDAEGVALITLDRPERYNALTFEVYRELADRFASLATDDRVHAVVITGEGKAFCSGGDVHDIIGKLFERNEEQVLEFTRMTGELIANIRKLEKPVIAAVNGMAAGRGFCQRKTVETISPSSPAVTISRAISKTRTIRVQKGTKWARTGRASR